MLPRRTTHLVGILFAALCLYPAAPIPAQVFDLDKDREPMVVLNGTWRFHTGDDPQWVDPAFDDSHWQLLKSEGGWGTQGYAGYSGFGWYRARLIIPASAPPLALYVGWLAISTNFQIFADGKMLDRCSWPSLPAAVDRMEIWCAIGNTTAAQPRTLVLAIRVWHWPDWSEYFSGGLQRSLRIGGIAQIEEYARIRTESGSWHFVQFDLMAILYGLAGFSALAFFLLRHREKEYLWFATYSVFTCASYCFTTYYSWHSLSIIVRDAINNILPPAALLCALEFYVALLKLRRNWFYWVASAGIGVYLAAQVLRASDLITIKLTNELCLLVLLPESVWVIYVVVRRAIQGSPDARLLVAPAILAPSLAIVSQLFWTAQVIGWIPEEPAWINSTFHWPFPFSLSELADFIFLNSMVAILLLRFNRSSKEEEHLATELEAARTVQQVLIPEEIPAIHGLAIECIYKPAGQVSGDFFQILPIPNSGALIVIGDVSGKGMPAAMTVSLLVGTVRTLAHYLQSPAEILTAMNQRMLGRSKHGFTTCLVLLLNRDGAAKVANAGHLAPYIGAQELAIENGLPLGLAAESIYTESLFQLEIGQELTLLTDGIAEARAKTGELFGFERTASISILSAEHMAATAAAFGQQDDITVLKIRRCPVGPAEPAISAATVSAD